jgi:hypothetical protein
MLREIIINAPETFIAKTNYFDAIPDEILLYIFSFFSQQELDLIKFTNKHWHEIITEDKNSIYRKMLRLIKSLEKENKILEESLKKMLAIDASYFSELLAYLRFEELSLNNLTFSQSIPQIYRALILYVLSVNTLMALAYYIDKSLFSHFPRNQYHIGVFYRHMRYQFHEAAKQFPLNIRKFITAEIYSAISLSIASFFLLYLIYKHLQYHNQQIRVAMLSQVSRHYYRNNVLFCALDNSEIKQILEAPQGKTYHELRIAINNDCDRALNLIHSLNDLNGFIDSLKFRNLTELPIQELRDPALKKYLVSKIGFWNQKNSFDPITIKGVPTASSEDSNLRQRQQQNYTRG